MYSCNSKGEKTDSEGSKCTKCNKERAKVLFSRFTKKPRILAFVEKYPFVILNNTFHRKRLIKVGSIKLNQKSTDRE